MYSSLLHSNFTVFFNLLYEVRIPVSRETVVREICLSMTCQLLAIFILHNLLGPHYRSHSTWDPRRHLYEELSNQQRGSIDTVHTHRGKVEVCTKYLQSLTALVFSSRVYCFSDKLMSLSNVFFSTNKCLHCRFLKMNIKTICRICQTEHKIFLD